MFGAIAAGLSIGSTLLGARSSRRANRDARAAAQDRSRIVAMENARERREALREFRMARAQNVAGGVAAGGVGAMTSSAVMGETQALGSQLRFNMDYTRRANELNESATRSEIRSVRRQGQAATWGAVSNIAGQFAQATGGYTALAGKLGAGR